MTSQEIRERYLKFFEKRGHKIIPSASLIPENDPSVLFTTAGMQQFKRYYLFPNEAPSARITTVQKCIRTGDINEVGDDTHLTFFEMLGNFSFGYPKTKDSYFKKEAIIYAWEFLTEILKIDIKRMFATYFKGEGDLPADTESYELLKSITKLSDEKIKGTAKDETFWSLGTEDSPGGPTVEFYVDGIEVWNLVFNQYVMKNDAYVKSENKGVDTGMGFERLVAMMQNKKNVYETDIFEPIISEIKRIALNYDEKSARIIADHIRAATFILSDGVVPSNTERGYVLRRILRRAVRYADKIGLTQGKESGKSDLSNISERFIRQNLVFYSDLAKQADIIFGEIEREEKKFRETLKKGEKKLGHELDNAGERGYTGYSGFDLYQTYGYPKELITEIVKEKGEKTTPNFDTEFEDKFKKHQGISGCSSEQKFKGGLAGTGEIETKYHTATHLLLAALRNVLKGETIQKGSNITAERMRFDFNWSEKLTKEQLKAVEDLVNKKIAEKIPVQMIELPKDEAKKIVTTLSFDLSKYGDTVKVYKIGDFSTEFCGGPHVSNTAELGHFKIVKEEASAAGVRRIKAILK